MLLVGNREIDIACPSDINYAIFGSLSRCELPLKIVACNISFLLHTYNLRLCTSSTCITVHYPGH
jgi:hypothetical protein